MGTVLILGWLDDSAAWDGPALVAGLAEAGERKGLHCVKIAASSCQRIPT